MTIEKLLLSTAAICLASSATIHAILKRRNYRAAAWWIGFSWVLPFVGPFFYFFGVNRIERKAARMRRQLQGGMRRAESQQNGAYELGHWNSLSRLVERVVSLQLLRGNKITAYQNGDEAYPVMLDAIETAEKSIGLATYIFENDKAGGFFVDALARAVKRGVQVRVLIDDVGAGWKWKSIFSELKEHGVEVAYFLPTFAPWRLAYMNLRSHRKILTIDGKVAFSGGMNIVEANILKINPKHPVQDLHFKIEGPVVAQVQEVFRLDWHFMTNEDLIGDDWFPQLSEVGKVFARGIPDGPDEDFEKCKWTLLSALSHARQRIRLFTPYFIPDSTLMAALNLASLSGVKVDIILPYATDLSAVNWATNATLWQVLERGCRVWFTPPPFDHSKLLLVDDTWVMFGSTNWDRRSLRLNFEFNVECYDKELNAKLNNWADQKIASAREITLEEIDARPFLIKLRDGVARLFSPIL